MTIRDMDKFVDGVWDWGVLAGCFGNTRISPSDVDGEVERNGHFLTLEAKSPNAGISDGQMRKLMHRVRRGDTVIVIWGEKGKPERIRIGRPYCLQEKQSEFYPNADLAKLRLLVSSWFDWANSNGAPQPPSAVAAAA